MKNRHWADGIMVGFDTETTSTDPQTARILQAAIVTHDPEGVIVEEDRIIYIDPGVEIPAEASAIHGITREKLAEIGAFEPRLGIESVVRFIECRSIGRGYPLVIYNACYDWPPLRAEVARLCLAFDRTPFILDPLVIDRAADKYRKGSRKLEAVAAHYKVPLDGAHDAAADARAALGIMRALLVAYPKLRDCSLGALQRFQAKWYSDWRDHINEYWASTGKTDRVTGDWPGILSAEAA